ncbi:IS5 family transposase [Ralstonia pseudosolanacearum]|uniref:IS5 family transposase n=1 Tax=Ralstonia solanacearum TaxID=305 RepID=A0AA92JUQ5_RALSL|nr:IS5 family transposase [Ralstonia pseudosolanacearum]QOK90668.1 IS5 family transposase [Ralstonia pseudosolanacearum]QOK91111.1 IS5 family transposase [Ralstonia pseudosolanacearum]QOK91697.1 IS5 family transposase [Ralstonia pseudosolanacearum]QOK93190.1 IS5 family transposase [Ralstonia pseudosolanacearum]QOK95987.1 IS5 family transposase [Ralstonia pseudosolanacearum]
MRKKTYPSDMSRERFEPIRPLLEQARKRTKPRTVDLYEVWCAVLYLLRTGCQWRALPSDFPKWRTVHSYFAKWSEPDEQGVSLLERALKKSQVGAARARQGRNACTTFLIVDAQSVKNTDTAAHKGYDAGKKVSGIKRHIAVDTQGLPHAVAVTTAEVTDRKGALQALKRCKPGLSRVQSLLADNGYVGEPFAQGVRDALSEEVTVQIAKRSELHTFKVIPQRWVVERSFAWLEKNRRLWKNCERKLNTSLQFVHLAFLALLLRRS